MMTPTEIDQRADAKYAYLVNVAFEVTRDMQQENMPHIRRVIVAALERGYRLGLRDA